MSPVYYRPHPLVIFSVCLSVHTRGGGGCTPVPGSFPDPFQGGTSVPGPFPGGGVPENRGTPPGQDWGTPPPKPGLGYPPPGEVTLRAVCLVWFPAGGLSCYFRQSMLPLSPFSSPSTLTGTIIAFVGSGVSETPTTGGSLGNFLVVRGGSVCTVIVRGGSESPVVVLGGSESPVVVLGSSESTVVLGGGSV